MSDRACNRSRPANRRLFLEALEDRRVMAGNVTVSLAGLNLYIRGDNADNAIDITALTGVNASGRVSITPQAGTTLNGQSNPLVARSFANINISMLRGDDTVNFIGDAAATDSVLGSLYVNQGEGDNTLAISDYNVGLSLVVRNGRGTDAVTLDNVDVGRDIVINNDASTAGVQTTSILNGTTAGRSIVINNLNGSNTVDFSGADAVTAGRDLAINNQGTGSADTSVVTLSNVAVTSNLDIDNRTQATVTLGDLAGPVTIGRNTLIRNSNPLADDVVTLQNIGSTFGSDSTHRLSIFNGVGNDSVTFAGITVNGNTNVINGDGDGTVTATGTATFNDSFNVVNGNGGTHSVTINDGTVQGNLNIINGNGVDNSVILGDSGTFTLGSRLTIHNGDASGTNTVNILDAAIGSSVSVFNGDATNNIALGETAAGAATFTAGGHVNLINYDGDSSVSVNSATIAGAFATRSGAAGAGGHTISFGELSDNSVGGFVSIAIVSGDTNISLAQLSIGRDLSIRTASGDDIINLALTGAAGVSVGGITFIDTAGGSDTLNMGTGTGTVTFLDVLTIRLGTGVDAMTIGTNTANSAGTAFATGDYFFDGGSDPAGSNTIDVSATVVDPFADLLTLLKYRNFSSINLLP